MTNIEKLSLIKRENLSGEFYFQTLLNEAFRLEMIDTNQIEKLQVECLKVLAKQTERYTGSESSSVRVEVAEGIFKSILFTISIALKDYDAADEAVRGMMEQGVEKLFLEGKKKIEIKMRATKHFHNMLKNNLFQTKNSTYRDTLVGGINGFFKLYRVDHTSHEIHITADYPLSIQVRDLAGIEFIQRYTEGAYYENMFLKLFEAKDVHRLLLSYDKNYDELIINIYNIVLTNAIGCVMLDKQPLSLNITKLETKKLRENLKSKTKEQLNKIVENASKTMVKGLLITSNPLKKYIEKTLPLISTEIFLACQNSTLERIFLEFEYKGKVPEIQYDFGEKMDNKKYRKLIDEINECRFIDDKILLIKNSVNSFADFKDVFSDAEFTDEEILEILKPLGTVELASLANEYQLYEEVIAGEFNEKQEGRRLVLKRFISTLDEEE